MDKRGSIKPTIRSAEEIHELLRDGGALAPSSRWLQIVETWSDDGISSITLSREAWETVIQTLGGANNPPTSIPDIRLGIKAQLGSGRGTEGER